VSQIVLAHNLRLPADIATESIAILAIKRAGKSTTARRLVEQLFHAKQQCVVVDPKGDWWGLLYGRDGKSPGLPFVVLGGEHGHIPLESGAGPQAIEKNGELIARLAAVERVSMVIDLSQFRKHELARFMTFFMETLYRLKAKDEYRTPMMLAIDEADAIAPQRIVKTAEKDLGPRMLGAAEDIVRRGGQRGIGVTLITQRAAVLNKNVLTQCGVLLALRTIASQDIAAIDDWVQEVHADKHQRDTCIGSLASLQTGEGWFWSTSFPAPDGLFQRAKFLMPDTFDSSATPKVGQTRVVPKNAADVDLKAFEREMAATIEKAKADDPKELRRRIAELEKQLVRSPATKAETAVTLQVEKWKREAGEWKGKAEAAAAAMKGFEKYSIQLVNTLGKIGELVTAGTKEKTQITVPVKEVNQALDRLSGPARVVPPIEKQPPRPAPGGSSEVGKGGIRRMLTALAQCPDGLTKDQIGVRAGLSSKSGSFGVYLGRMRSSGWVEDRQGKIFISDGGLQALGSYEELPRGSELLEYWMKELGGGKARMLQALYDARGEPMDKAQLGNLVGMSEGSGSFGVYLGRLRSLELIEGPGSALVASQAFYE
jgi:hypothetical protein